MGDDHDEARLVTALRTALQEQGAPASSASASSIIALVRAPGRVNLIGEHIDYHCFAILPMVLEQHVQIAVGKQAAGTSRAPGRHVSVKNPDGERYPGTHVLSLDEAEGWRVGSGGLQWSDYVRCALQGVLAHPQCAHLAHDQLDGLVLVVHGCVPPAAGLSSSSAMVVASALAFLWALDVALESTDLAQLCIDCERLVGTAGGGMDQSASILAEAGKALYIEFEPTLLATPVPLPEDAVFVIANSLVVAEKAQAAFKHYNLRVVEGRLAIALLGESLGLQLQEWSALRTLHALDWALRGKGPEGPGPLTPELIRSILHAGTYTIPELQAALGVTDLVATVLSDRHEAAALVFAHNTEFNLRDRVVHVVEEAVRVEEFRRVAAADGTTFPDGPRLDRLGALMRSSHESCMALYECSHPELDALVAICEAAGAKGARLTGAGWGGCAVSLVHKSEVWAVVARVWQDFYVERCGLRADDTDTQRRCLFVSAPGAGARVRELL